MTIGLKLKAIAETIEGFNVLFDNESGAQIDLSKTLPPMILIYTQNNGQVNSNNAHYRDNANFLFIFLDKQTRDYRGSQVDPIIDALKKKTYELAEKIKRETSLKLNTTQINYTVRYNQFGENLCGVSFSLNILERIGTDLGCEIETYSLEILESIYEVDSETGQRFVYTGRAKLGSPIDMPVWDISRIETFASGETQTKHAYQVKWTEYNLVPYN